MKWRDHLRIARAIARISDLPAKELADGSIAPDRVRVRYERHHGNLSAAMHQLRLARKSLLSRGTRKKSTDLSKAAFHVGMALHYIHDSCTGKGFLGLFHGSVEEGISSIDLPKDAFEHGLDSFQPHPAKLKKKLGEIQYSNSPERALWNAAFFSALAVKSTVERGDMSGAKKEAELMDDKFRKWLLVVTGPNLVLLGALCISRRLEYLVLLVLSLPLYWIPLHFQGRRNELRDWFGLENRK